MVWIRIIFFALFSYNVFSDELSSEELIYFNFLDLNDDKYISTDEIDKSTAIIFQLIDKNNDKKLSYDELNELKKIIKLLR